MHVMPHNKKYVMLTNTIFPLQIMMSMMMLGVGGQARK